MRRLRNVSALIALFVIPFAPIVRATWAIHQTRDRSGLSSSPRAEDDEQVAQYKAQRNPAVDRLLPEGAPGVRFTEDIDNAGEADPVSGTITLRASTLTTEWPESVELHERAHLVFAFLTPRVVAVMRGLPKPAAGEYAATNRNEHFAEMAFKAWTIVEPPVGSCLAQSREDALLEAEARVPGTAGFVDWYLRDTSLEVEGDRARLASMAAALSAPRRAEWDALWRAIESRRHPDGTFTPWRRLTVRESIEALRAEEFAAGGWFATLYAGLLAPSLALLSLAGA